MEFTQKNWLSPTKKVNKNRKYLNFEKKTRGIALRNICTKFGADWKIYRHRNHDKTSVTHTKRSQNHTMTQNHTITDI